MCFQVCNKDVKHEYTAILNHLRVKHNMTLTHYTQIYVRGELQLAGPDDLEPVEITPELSIEEETEEEVEEEVEEVGDITKEMEMDEAVTSGAADNQEEFYVVDPSDIN